RLITFGRRLSGNERGSRAIVHGDLKVPESKLTNDARRDVFCWLYVFGLDFDGRRHSRRRFVERRIDVRKRSSLHDAVQRDGHDAQRNREHASVPKCEARADRETEALHWLGIGPQTISRAAVRVDEWRRA